MILPGIGGAGPASIRIKDSSLNASRYRHGSEHLEAIQNAVSTVGKYDPKRVRILYIIDQLCEPGGAERALLKMIEGLPKEKFDCRLVTFKHDPEHEMFRKLPCPLYVLPLGRTYNLNALRSARRIRSLIRSQEIDIVHTFHETSDLWGGLVAKASGCPVLVSSRRDMGILRTKKHMLGYRVNSLFVDKVLSVSERVRKYCIRVDKLSPAKVLTLHNGIDLAKLDSAPKGSLCKESLGIPERTPIITTVGHIRKIKGVDVLIRAAARVCQEFPEAAFLVVGAPTEASHFDDLKHLADVLGLSRNFKFLGYHEEAITILKNSHVFCLPSRSEGFSNALIEAMACALPCVATDVGGNDEAITDGLNGFLVPSEDAWLLAERIMYLLRAPGKASEMGRAARARVEEQFTFGVMIRKLVGVYDELVVSKRI